MKKTVVESYSSGSKCLHWIVAAIVILMLSCSFFMDDLPSVYQPTVYMIHKSFGLTILFLMLLRLFWIVHTGKPPLPFSVSRWEVILSQVIQWSFYLFLIAMALVGWTMSVAANRVPTFFGLFNMPLYGVSVNEDLAKFLANVHEIIAWILIGLVIVHIAGALKHHFIDKDKILRRMLSDSRKHP